MKKKFPVIFSILLCLAIAISLWFLSPAGHVVAFLTPISFWGKVVDEKGNPVSDANVKLGANDNPNPMGTGSNYERKSDASGLFSIRGIHGISLSVEVSKDGYYSTEQSQGGLGYVVISKSDMPRPTSEAPAIFILRKKGEMAKLIEVKKYIKIAKDGTPLEISLANAESVPVGTGDLRVEAWTDDGDKDAKRHYNWRCRVTVPNGGLIERKGAFNFEAPLDGYREFDEIVMRKDAERWLPQVEKEYFLKLGNGKYVRIHFEMIAGGDHFFAITSYLNPQSGSRNLESDPKQKF